MRNLAWVINNTRFLIFEWVRVKNLASHVLGQQFSDSEIFVAEMLVSALTMKLGLEGVKPLLKSEDN